MADHLVVFAHGLLAHAGTLDWLVKTFMKQYGDQIVILLPQVNKVWLSLHGVDACGERLFQTITEFLDANPHVSKVSFVGHSAGGLYSRYAIGRLLQEGYFNKVQPINFITLATPHLGVRKSERGCGDCIWNCCVSMCVYRSGTQFVLRDKISKPLLLRMTQPNSIFFEALKLFPNLVAYANIRNDRPVPYYTAAISTHNPYKHSGIPESHIKNYPTIINVHSTQSKQLQFQRDLLVDSTLKRKLRSARKRRRKQKLSLRRRISGWCWWLLRTLSTPFLWIFIIFVFCYANFIVRFSYRKVRLPKLSESINSISASSTEPQPLSQHGDAISAVVIQIPHEGSMGEQNERKGCDHDAPTANISNITATPVVFMAPELPNTVTDIQKQEEKQQQQQQQQQRTKSNSLDTTSESVQAVTPLPKLEYSARRGSSKPVDSRHELSVEQSSVIPNAIMTSSVRLSIDSSRIPDHSQSQNPEIKITLSGVPRDFHRNGKDDETVPTSASAGGCSITVPPKILLANQKRSSQLLNLSSLAVNTSGPETNHTQQEMNRVTFKRDRKRKILRQMQRNLQQLDWTIVDVLLSGNAHMELVYHQRTIWHIVDTFKI